MKMYMSLTQKEHGLILICINDAISKAEENMRNTTDKELKQIYAASISELSNLRLKIGANLFGQVVCDVLTQNINKR